MSKLSSPQPKKIRGINSLPSEILVQIAENLVPEPVTRGLHDTTPLRTSSDPKWNNFFARQKDLKNLCLVNRQFNEVASPIGFPQYLAVATVHPLLTFRMDSGERWALRDELARTLDASLPECRDCLFIQRKTVIFDMNDLFAFNAVESWALFGHGKSHLTNIKGFDIAATQDVRDDGDSTTLGTYTLWAKLILVTRHVSPKSFRLLLRAPTRTTAWLFAWRLAEVRVILRQAKRMMKMEEPTISMEGLFGPITQLSPIFGVAGFLEVDDDTGIWYNTEPAESNQPVPPETIETAVSALPASARTLTIMDWFDQYSNPEKLLPIQAMDPDDNGQGQLDSGEGHDENQTGAAQRLEALYEALMAALGKLAPVLAKDTKAKTVIF
ncbi:hypothetical protein B0T14DRAFT_604928 [Immersiella caudata]|uniref:Uncharacterized protein n=1 Tax=Immersiella caudata TaxID=314043 RepID=A0AA40BWX3_9PEZI|nr:hypothetical protein B0T14DRAFT_604928 [Immersiella caudata]